jgi:hypothetical protein
LQVCCSKVMEVCSGGRSPPAREQGHRWTAGGDQGHLWTAGAGQGYGWTAGTGQGHWWPDGGWRPGSPMDGGRRSGSPMAGRPFWVRVAGGRRVETRVTPGWRAQVRATHRPPPLCLWTTTTTQPDHLPTPCCMGHLLWAIPTSPENFRDPRGAVLWGGGRRWVALRAIANPIQNRSRRRPNS